MTVKCREMQGHAGNRKRRVQSRRTGQEALKYREREREGEKCVYIWSTHACLPASGRYVHMRVCVYVCLSLCMHVGM